MGFLDATGITTLVNKLKTKFQPLLVSGTNIKTVGGYSLLGSGNVPFPTVPIAWNTAPLMDGTASSGSGTSYARGNHRHPTDTSRQETLVSGTNIKTINGNSLLGSGDLTVGGGGGSSYVIDVNMSSGSITSYDLHSATAADISSALSADPETKVILKIAVDEEASPAVVVPSLGNRANGEFSAIYMRALFSALDYSIGDVYGYDITLRLNANGLDVMHYQSTAY